MADLRERYGAMARRVRATLAEHLTIGHSPDGPVPAIRATADKEVATLLLRAGALAAEECGEKIGIEFVRADFKHDDSEKRAFEHGMSQMMRAARRECRALAAELREGS